jgi:hypothetical protein
MSGSSIEEARNALQLCLRSLPAGILFNIVGFGSTFQKLFPKSRPYDEKSLADASAHVKALEADLGGTEILGALVSILKPAVPEGTLRQLFILTDGQVSNTDEVLALVREHAATSRAFTFGIGAGASAHLVKGLARAGGGEAEMIAPGRADRGEGDAAARPGPRTRPRATSASTGARRRCGRRRTRSRHSSTARGSSSTASSKGRRRATSSCGRRPPPGKSPSRPGSRRRRRRRETSSPRSPRGPSSATSRKGRVPLHNRRGSLQGRNTKDKVKEEIVRLGVTYGLVSRETSYVAVEERENPETGEMTLVKVPIALTRGWGGMEPSTGVMACMAAPPSPDRMMSFDSGAHLISPRYRAPAPIDLFGEPPRLSRRIREAPGEDSGLAPLAPSTRALDRLVALQKADGSWDLDEALATVLGVPLATIEQALAGKPFDPALFRRAGATALALLWLERSAADAKGEWRLLARKASAWLDASGALPPGGGRWKVFATTILGSRPGA